MKIRIPTPRQALVAGLLIGTLVVLLLYLMGAFTPKVTPGPPRPVLPPAAGLDTLPVRALQEPVEAAAVGTVEAVQRIRVGSRLLARVHRMHVTRAGQPVTAGEVLVELDKDDLTAALQEARAAERAAEATLDQARTDLRRIEKLRAEEIASVDALEQQQTAVARAEAELDRARQAASAAATRLEYATIRAPAGGIVIDKHVEQGDLVQPGEVLVSLYDPDRLQLVAVVREQLAAGLAIGDAVRVTIEAMDETCEATIAEIVPEAEEGSRSFEVKVTGPCPPGVYSGMFGRLHVPLGTREVVRIPNRAVQRAGQVDLVYAVLPGDRLQRRFVRLGATKGDTVEVLAGLEPGETIAADAAEAARR